MSTPNAAPTTVPNAPNRLQEVAERLASYAPTQIPNTAALQHLADRYDLTLREVRAVLAQRLRSVGGMTSAEIQDALHLSRSETHRLINGIAGVQRARASNRRDVAAHRARERAVVPV